MSQSAAIALRLTDPKGTGIGALICAFFGGPWMFWAVAWSGNRSRTWFYALDIVYLAMIGLAILGIKVARRIASGTSKEMQSWRPPRVLYWIVTGTEWVLVVGAAIWLSLVGRSDLIPQVCGVIVGLHFLPLARIFRAPIYHATGAAMVLGELASLVLSRGYGRNIIGCGVPGLILWTTALVLLARIFSAKPPEGIRVGSAVS